MVKWLLHLIFQLVFGNSGVLQTIGSGKGYIEMSTVDAETVTEISEVSDWFLFFDPHISVKATDA